MAEQFCFNIEDSGDGPLQVLVSSDEMGEQVKELLREMGERAVRVVTLEEQAVADDVEDADLEVASLCCTLEPDRPWNGSVCEMITGLTEEEAREEIIKLDLLKNAGV